MSKPTAGLENHGVACERYEIAGSQHSLPFFIDRDYPDTSARHEFRLLRAGESRKVKQQDGAAEAKDSIS